MKEYLIKLFNYNDWANRKLLEIIKQLPDKEDAIKLFSHLITSQDKWLNRVTRQTDDNSYHWFGQIFPIESIEKNWLESFQKWADTLQSASESDLNNNIVFVRVTDKKEMKVKLKDIILQLNYHSIHHRAQINKLISQQGLTPPPTDYILTAIEEV
ncbi:MAG: DinB family protein [Flavobacteriales bacterium]|nr:DinB family protein [Flavobacteriales bacterium]MCB9448049.1 DinB family protein [Flavobacteriales bacterium]